MPRPRPRLRTTGARADVVRAAYEHSLHAAWCRGVLIVVLAAASRPPEGRIPGWPRSHVVGRSWGASLVGVVWPLVEVSRVHVDARGPTRSCVVGRTESLITSPCAGGERLEARPSTVKCLVPDAAPRAPASCRTSAAQRGVFGFLRIELRSSGPLGVMQVERHHWVPLPREVCVAPRPVPVAWLPQLLGHSGTRHDCRRAALRRAETSPARSGPMSSVTRRISCTGHRRLGPAASSCVRWSPRRRPVRQSWSICALPTIDRTWPRLRRRGPPVSPAPSSPAVVVSC